MRRGKPVGVTRMGEKLAAWRDSQGSVTVMHDLCPHRGVALSAGEVQGDCIRCPFHGFKYDASGRCTVIPANSGESLVPKVSRVQAYPTHEAYGLIFIYWGQPAAEAPPPRWFDDLDESFRYGSVRDPWRAHYSRVIENQLDVPHVPFIHHNTIGSGNRTVIDGPWIEWQDPDRFFVYTSMRQEDCTPARRADDVARPDKPFHLEFIFPNLWQNWISAKVRVVIGPEDACAFAKYFRKESLPFVGLPDPGASVLKRYGREVNLFELGRMPPQVLIDRAGVARFVHYGHNMSDIPSTQEMLALGDEINAQRS